MNEFENISWIAVISGTVISFLVGWGWYHEKFFGAKWAQGSKVELGSAKDMPVFAMVTQLLGLFLFAMVIGITAQFDMLITAVFTILAICVLSLSAGGFVGKSTYALVVDAAYLFVAGVVMIVMQGIF
ncbi:MAG: DUF1761 domain-containing protein [Saccharospirillaceae bacterium]|nr:hypothetical protein [Pseudomonadales bacterium]NRB77795.1 DUF1761 domain-containing protein [Saccharospirillaceae bacterium]